jgi:hypothetical protein
VEGLENAMKNVAKKTGILARILTQNLLSMN